LRNHATLQPCNARINQATLHGTEQSRNLATQQSRNLATQQSCNLQRNNHATLQRNNHATLQRNNHATLLRNNHATLRHNNHATLQRNNNATITQVCKKQNCNVVVNLLDLEKQYANFCKFLWPYGISLRDSTITPASDILRSKMSS
jgi:hypothetical protein